LAPFEFLDSVFTAQESAIDNCFIGLLTVPHLRKIIAAALMALTATTVCTPDATEHSAD